MSAPTLRLSGPVERPLNPAARGSIVLAAATTMLLFYVAAAGSVLVLLVVFVLIAAATLAAARFGLASFVSQLGAAPARVMGILVRNLWLPTSPAYRVTLGPTDAPDLFETVRRLSAKVGVEPPRTIYIEMNAGAWVQMHGFRRAGRTTLGIGFDLLAGLNATEFEGVLAHELAHAKLVRRGFSRWLKKGLGRLSLVTSELTTCAEAFRAAKKPSTAANGAEKLFGTLAMRAARFVATYSRQDEFEADRLAADMVGADALISALTKLERQNAALARLPWNERLAHVAAGQQFTTWLVGELAQATADDSPLAKHAIDPFSTHPSTRDRVLALPGRTGAVHDDRRAVDLLASPDLVAERLVGEIQRVVLAQEEADTRRLTRATKKWARRRAIGIGPLLGVVAICFGVLFGVIAFVEGFSPDILATAVALTATGIALYAFAVPRPKALPIPAYGTLSYARKWKSLEEYTADESAVERELNAATAAVGSKRQRKAVLLDHAHRALADCDYLRAGVASGLLLELHKKSIDGALAHAIAAAALGANKKAQQLLQFVQVRAGFTSRAAKWGAAWTMILLKDAAAEGPLQQLHAREPNVATFAALLAYVQSERGKLWSAVRNAKLAAAADPENRVIALLLANLLLDAGRVADAARLLEGLEELARTDQKAALLSLRLALLQRDAGRASEWAEIARGLDASGESLLGLAYMFGTARVDDAAVKYFGAALDAGFMSEAHVGLATIASFRGDREESRRHLLAALRLDQGTRSIGATPYAVFQQILNQLNALDDRRVACRAWIATIPAGQALLAERSLLVSAPDLARARDLLEVILRAMSSDESQVDVRSIAWKEAPPDQQPVRPVQPGVVGIVA